MKTLWILCWGVGFGLAGLSAQASVTLDWSNQPQGTLPKNGSTYSEAFTASDGGAVTATVQPSSRGVSPQAFGSAHLQTPAVTSTIFDGGILPSGSASNLSIVADFRPTSTDPDPKIEVTLDFSGYAKGVSNVNFSLYDVDGNDNARFQDRITFLTSGAALTGSADNSTSGNVVVGKAAAPNQGPGSNAGNVSVTYGSMPLHQIKFDFDGTTNVPALHGFAIGNLVFTPVPEASQLAIGLAACAFAAFWVRKSGLRKATGAG